MALLARAARLAGGEFVLQRQGLKISLVLRGLSFAVRCTAAVSCTSSVALGSFGTPAASGAARPRALREQLVAEVVDVADAELRHGSPRVLAPLELAGGAAPGALEQVRFHARRIAVCFVAVELCVRFLWRKLASEHAHQNFGAWRCPQTEERWIEGLRDQEGLLRSDS